MKTQLRVRPHGILPGAQVFEVVWNGQVIAEVTGADGPGVRVLTQLPVRIEQDRVFNVANMVDVLLDPGRLQ